MNRFLVKVWHFLIEIKVSIVIFTKVYISILLPIASDKSVWTLKR